MILPTEVILWSGDAMGKRGTPPVPEDPMGPLIEGLEAVMLLKYLSVVAITIIIYDTILTYDREVQVIWGSRWSFVRVLFTLARYFIPCSMILCMSYIFIPRIPVNVRKYFCLVEFIGLISLMQVCKVEIKVVGALLFLSKWITMCILLLRVWAMWGLKNWMLVVLLLAFIVSQLPSTVLGLIAGQRIVVVENPLPGVLTGCTTSSHASHKSNWISVYLGTISFEATLFVLTLLRAWMLHRDGANTPIITLLTRDGAWYFLVRISSLDPPFAAHDPFFYVLMRIQAALVSVSLVAIGTTIPKTRPAAFFSQ
ncbi:hypothetical protein FRC08_002645 [Ceratobasidium sp. 394]|nr:hypothetical protein FRC08_002645 [Ceratobasidium sp. 394]